MGEAVVARTVVETSEGERLLGAAGAFARSYNHW